MIIMITKNNNNNSANEEDIVNMWLGEAVNSFHWLWSEHYCLV